MRWAGGPMIYPRDRTAGVARGDVRVRWIGGTLLAVAAVLGGCATVDLDFQREYPADLIWSSIRPGETTRAEVLQLLGPPDEMRRLALFERARSNTHQSRKALEARDLFRRDAYTYAFAHRDIDVVGLLPVGLAIFRVAWLRSWEDRWRIEFDERDVVRSVSHVDEGAGS